ncbi:hypothetical protein AHAS_Ahas20G0222400 [Arachis hypogaea]
MGSGDTIVMETLMGPAPNPKSPDPKGMHCSGSDLDEAMAEGIAAVINWENRFAPKLLGGKGRDFLERLLLLCNTLGFSVETLMKLGMFQKRKRGHPPNMVQIRRFKEWMEACNLIDLGFSGTRFTWRGPIWEDGCRIFKHLEGRCVMLIGISAFRTQ